MNYCLTSSDLIIYSNFSSSEKVKYPAIIIMPLGFNNFDKNYN